MERLRNDELNWVVIRNKVFQEFKIIAEEYGIDISDCNCNPRQFSFILGEINRRLIEPHKQILMLDKREYDPDKVVIFYKYITRPLIKLYKQENSISNVVELMGMEKQSIYNWVSTKNFDFHKIIMSDDEDSLEQMLQDARLNPMKILPSLNKKHGWNQSGGYRETVIVPLDASNLPKLCGNGAQLSLDDSQNEP